MTRRVALITGSSRGIGRAIATRLAEDGLDVVINYASSREAAETLAAELECHGGKVIAVGARVDRADDRDRLVRTTYEALGRLDVLVNNAGITSPGRHDLLHATEAGFDTVMDTNLKGPFFLSQAAARSMIEQIQNDTIERGHIININSISSYAVSVNRADYCIAKAGMQMMTWQFAARLAEERIQVFEVCPGVIASDMTAPVKEKYDQLIAEGLSPIRRWGTPEDVADAVSCLVSGSLPFSTGERINVDGGYHIRRL